MSEATKARQAALAAELRALYGYALVGPRLDSAGQALARSCIAAHEQLRDALTATIEAARGVPLATRPDYPDLYPVTDLATARTRAVDLEHTCASAWRYLYAELAAPGPATGSSTRDRASAQRALTACAVRATRWRLQAHAAFPTVAFPGID
ncbi:DUF4439 domain-containing protein [uncultured Jatrophihabitans sp.]|uniref:DUF4439 domain-containing protein n=1 Tax=uncultured Jatrophihabitans sp. TaxID=1610747 RepID=UPI0035CC731F